MNPVGISVMGMVRRNNEDAIFVCGENCYELPNLYIVADGMGGHQAGEIASSGAIEAFCEYCRQTHVRREELMDFLVGGVVYANQVVFEMSSANSEYTGMGTTFSLCVLWGGQLYMAHIGDSRIYVVNDEVITQITTDHTFIHEMMKRGQLTASEARTHPQRNMITRALGVELDANVDGYLYTPTDGDKILLCSDGLTNMLSDDEIFRIVNSGKDNKSITENLVDAANEKGGIDNISVILFDTTAR